MRKPDVLSSARRRFRRRRPAELPNFIEGQIAEICRDLSVQAKRMRELQEQADELRTAMRQWARQSDTDSSREPVNRGGRR